MFIINHDNNKHVVAKGFMNEVCNSVTLKSIITYTHIHKHAHIQIHKHTYTAETLGYSMAFHIRGSDTVVDY